MDELELWQTSSRVDRVCKLGSIGTILWKEVSVIAPGDQVYLRA